MVDILPTLTELTPEQKGLYDLLPSNLSRGLVLTKASTKPYLLLGLSFRSGWLSPDIRELVILRVGAATGTEYEVHHHVPEADSAGVAPDTVRAALAGATTVADERTDALLDFVDQLIAHAQGGTPDATGVRKHFSDNEVAEVVLLTGHYLMTGIFVRTLKIEPEESD